MEREETEIDRLPIDLLAYIFGFIISFTDLAQASSVCRKWKEGVKQSLAQRNSMSFAGWKMDDDSTTRLVHLAYNLKELDMYVSASLSLYPHLYISNNELGGGFSLMGYSVIVN